jgi:hypothetical protein
MNGRSQNSKKVPFWKGPGGRKKPDDNHDDKDGAKATPYDSIVAAAIPHLTGLALKTIAGITLALYVLNQQHMLPRQLSAVVSKSLFWPTLPITASRRIGKWMTRIDETIVLGGAPFGFLGFPETLYEEYGVRHKERHLENNSL